MQECTRCGGYKPSRDFYSHGATSERMAECKDCNRRRKADAYDARTQRPACLARYQRNTEKSA